MFFAIIWKMERRKDLINIFLLLLVAISFWGKTLFSDQTLFILDLSTEIIPKRSFWASSGGFVLWNPYNFFGMPYSANPQSQVFYPLSIFYLLFGAERGLVYFIFAHHLIFLLLCYFAFRSLRNGPELSMLLSLGLGLGGVYCSLSLLIVLLGTVSWMPGLILILGRFLERSWLKAGFFMAPFLALQVLAGEIQLAVMSWVFVIFLVFLSGAQYSGKRFFKILGAFFIAGILGFLLSAVQIFLTLEMIPFSSRTGGLSITEALEWSLKSFRLLSVVLPNYFLPADTGLVWSLGFFKGFGYFFSLYLGVSVLLLAVYGIRKKNLEVLIWLLFILVGLLLSPGQELPFYKWLWHFPLFKLFRIPEKFFLFVNLGVVMLSGIGYKLLNDKKKIYLPLAFLFIGLGIILFSLLIIYPLKVEEFSADLIAILNYLKLRSVFRTVGFLSLTLGGILLLNGENFKRWGWVLVLIIFLDLFSAHRLLNPPISRSFYHPPNLMRKISRLERKSPPPIRILCLTPPQHEITLKVPLDPVYFYSKIRNSIIILWHLCFHLNSVRGYSSFYLEDCEVFDRLFKGKDLIEKKALVDRAGVEYFYYRLWGGFIPISGAFPRAMIFYKAYFLAEREKILKLWSDFNFPVRILALIEAKRENNLSYNPPLFSEPAEIIQYENEKVVIKVKARQSGWLVLLDTYYPGWKAYLDGREVKIYRADGFFRAVEVPEGEHIIEFVYFPKSFVYGAWVSGISWVLWLMGMFIIIRKR